MRRKHSEEADDDAEHQSPAKRERTAHSSKYCRMCKCRLELAVREIGKCKCGMFVFALLFRCYTGYRHGACCAVLSHRV